MKKLLENFRKCISTELAEGRTAEWKWFLEELIVELLQTLSVLNKNSFKDYKTAEKYLLMARIIDPGNHKILLGLCEFYHSMMQIETAAKLGKLAIEATQEQDSTAYNNMAILASELNDYKSAMQFYKKAIELNKDNYVAKFGLACEKIRRGNFKEGWKEYQIRYKAFAHLGAFLQKYPDAKYWNGKNIKNKTLVIYSEQGIGDFVFGMRYLPCLLNQNMQVIFDVDNNIRNILEKSKFKNIKYFKPEMKADYSCGIMSLPFLLSKNDYLAEEYQNIFKQVKTKPHKKPKIGITIAGNKSHASDYRRSINLSCLKDVLEDKNFDFYLLQTKKDLIRERKNEVVNLLDTNFPGIDLGNKMITFGDTLDILYSLDGLVTIDTSVAHLGGAIGLPVFLLADKACDFRWQNSERTTLWYNSWRIHKQNVLYDWTSAVNNCHQDLLQFFNIETA